MSNLELKKVMEKLGIQALRKDNETKEITYFFNGIHVIYKENNSTCVEGNIPYDVALLIAKNYPELRNQILPFGSRTNTKEEVRKAKKLTKDNRTVIDGYWNISAKGLIVLLTELEYYHQYGVYTEELRKKFKVRQEEILDSYGKSIIEEHYSTLGYTKEEWRTANFDKGYSNLEAEIVPYMEELSKNMNPFANGRNNIKSLEDLNNGLTFVFRNSYSKQEGCGFSIKGENETQSNCYTGIHPDYAYLLNEFKFKTDNSEYVEILSLIEKGYGSKIWFTVYGSDGYQKIDVAYNFESGQVEEYGKSAIPINQEQIDLLKMYLEQANVKAKNLIADKIFSQSKKKVHKK